MTGEEALAAIAGLGDPARAAGSAAYHKTTRPYLGVRVPDLTELAKGWRVGLSVPERVNLASALWKSNIHEARVAAAKLLVQARIAGDGPVWDFFLRCVPDFDGWSIADHMSDAAARRLVADPARVAELEPWVRSPHLWTRRAALVTTLPWTKQNHPKPGDLQIRDRVLGWAAELADDREWFIQKAIAWWLRELSHHDPDRTRAWLATHGHRLKPFARKEAARHLSQAPTLVAPQQRV